MSVHVLSLHEVVIDVVGNVIGHVDEEDKSGDGGGGDGDDDVAVGAW